MLDKNDQEKLKEYIDELIENISSDVKSNIGKGMSDKQVIENLINTTVTRLTPESKMLVSSTYNIMMEQTLTDSLYDNPQNKAAFYEMNLPKELNSKFNFDIPQNIDYEESKKEINKWVKMGAVVVSGGVISISLGSYIPIGIAVLIAGIMSPLLKDRAGKTNINLDSLIDEYLDNVKQSLWNWIYSIVEYYDGRIGELKRKLVR